MPLRGMAWPLFSLFPENVGKGMFGKGMFGKGMFGKGISRARPRHCHRRAPPKGATHRFRLEWEGISGTRGRSGS
jgi:hypothetical protein